MPEIFSSKKAEPKNKMTNKKKKSEESKVPHRHVDEYSEVLRSEEPCTNHLAAFAPKPVQTFFDAQDPDEHILLLLRQHPVSQFKKIFIILLLLVLPFFFAAFNVFSFLPANFSFAATLLWYLLVSAFSFEVFLTWFFSVYIITDERIIDVDFISLIYKDVSTAKIDKIEDVTAITGGAIRSIVNYGTVKIQTAAANAELEFENVPQPAKITRLLNELILEEEREKIEGRVR